MKWKNRIIGEGTEDPKGLKANPWNFRTHPDFQRDVLSGVLDEVGWVQNVVVNKRTGNLIDGHLRVELAIENKEELLPVVYVDLSEDEEKKIIATIDPIAALAESDNEILDKLLSELKTDNESLNQMFEDMKPEIIDPPDEKDDEIPENVKTICKPGDLWQLGNHRLLCGDATKKEDVEKLMAGQKAGMIFTDPPYNVDYGANKNHPSWKIRKIQNDKQSSEDWIIFNEKLANIFKEYCDGDLYIFGASGYDGMKARCIFIEHGLHWSATIIWKKQQLVLSPAKFQRIYEPCLYGWYGKSSFVGDRKNTEVWEIARPLKSELHPTMKPVELCEKAIRLSSKINNIVMDLFLGSWSTLIACEKTDRKCYGIEIDSHYCDVIIKRWEDYTNKKAKKIN